MPFQEAPNNEQAQLEAQSQKLTPEVSPELMEERAISEIESISDPFQQVSTLFPEGINQNSSTEFEMLAPTLNDPELTEPAEITPTLPAEAPEITADAQIQTIEIQDKFSLEGFNEEAQPNITEYLARFDTTPFQTSTKGNIRIRNAEGITLSRLPINTPIAISNNLIKMQDSEGTQITYGEILGDNQPTGEFVPLGFLNDSIASNNQDGLYQILNLHHQTNIPESRILEIAATINKDNVEENHAFLALVSQANLSQETIIALQDTLPPLALIRAIDGRTDIPESTYTTLIQENQNNHEVLLALTFITGLPESAVMQLLQINNNEITDNLVDYAALTFGAIQYLLSIPNNPFAARALTSQDVTPEEYLSLLALLNTYSINVLIDVYNSNLDNPERLELIKKAALIHPERLLLSRTQAGLTQILETGARNTSLFTIPIDETLGRINQVTTETVQSLMPADSTELEINDMRIAITRNLHFKNAEPTTENIILAHQEIIASQEAIRDLALYKDRTVIYLADSELTNTGEHRFGKQDAVQGVQNQDPTSLTFHRLENRENNQEAEELKQTFLNNLTNSAFPLTLLYDGHGSPNYLININAEIGISSAEFAQALIARYQRPEFQNSTSPDIIILTSCYSANLIRNVLSTLAMNNVAPLPIMTSEAEFGQIAYDNNSNYGTSYMQNALGLEAANTNGQIATMGNILDFNTSEYDRSNPIIYIPTQNNLSQYQQVASNDLPTQDTLAA